MTLLVDNPFELTTAITDLLLGCVALIGFLSLGSPRRDRFQYRIWQALLLSLGCSSFLGASLHAFRMGKGLNDLLWHPLYFLLGLTLTLLALLALATWRGEDAARRAMKWLLPLPLVVVLVTWLGGGAFLWFILFEAAIMVFATAVYVRLSIQGSPGSRLILSGLLISLAAAIAQAAGPYTFNLIWSFDHNGLFHLIQLPGVVLFILGAKKA